MAAKKKVQARATAKKSVASKKKTKKVVAKAKASRKSARTTTKKSAPKKTAARKASPKKASATRTSRSLPDGVGRPGDLIVIDSPQVGSPAREGEVLQVNVSDISISYRVRWADGHETLIAPKSGAARIVPAGTSR